MTPVPLPRTIDDPPYIILWRVDDLAPPMLFLVIGMFLGRPFVLCLVGMALSFVYRRYREGRPEMFALHALYWWGIWPSRGRTWPNPFSRNYHP